jgi:iron complex outermembrane receptor protein
MVKSTTTAQRRAALKTGIHGLSAAGFTMLALPALIATTLPTSSLAQSSTDALLEEIVVTARKREEFAQDVPISVSAYSSDQLEALKIRDLTNLSVSMPNVATDDIGTARGTANFSIRGLGINSSIPSIDPTVGVFVDGIYIGQNAGVTIDMFDVESIEVLRGPQGTLFGRNVTGGAVLVNSKGPTDEFEFSARASIEAGGDGGHNTYAMASISGPLGDSAGFRLSLYNNSDDGYFENQFNGEDFGEADTTIFRPTLTWRPSEAMEMTFRYEHHESDGDGPASQNHTNGFGVAPAFAEFDRDSFDFSIDEEGFYDYEVDAFTWQTDWDVSFGEGTITNIFGWRDREATTLGDIDAQPVWLFHAPAWNDSEQISNELRYNGQFDKTNLTLGVFYFDNEITYHERRNLLGLATGGVAPALTQDGGGDYTVESTAFFGSIDYDINDQWMLTTGLRFSREEKDAKIASLVFNVNSPCNVVTTGDCPFDFVDDETWNSVSGKLGLTYDRTDDQRLYGHYSRSYRSGGYNLRNTAVDTVNLGPGPFDEEQVDAFEFGAKTTLSNGGRFNVALFYTQIDDMQREVNLADPIAGVVHVIQNTADADILGFELDGVFPIGDNTLLTASLGWIDADYSDVTFDLNSDGVVNAADEDLDLPRAADLTYSLGLNHDWELNSGLLSGRLTYSHRDEAAYTDNNRGFFLEQDILDAGLDFHYGENWIFSLYGRNLLDEVNHGGDTQLPSMLGPLPLGGTFSPLIKGRIIGFDVTFRM